jgi:hypothetical protein
VAIGHWPKKERSDKSMAEKKDDRARNWTFVIYPTEGTPPAPLNWRDILDDEHIPWIESPLHDKDKNADGELKKAHIHILMINEGHKSFEQMKEFTDKLNAPIPQKCSSAKGLVRYMAHLDNPEKVQYSISDIIGHGGADIAEYLKPTSSSRYQLIKEMMDFVREKNIIEMEDLLTYASNERFDDWFPLLCDNSAYIMGAMIKSRRHRSERAPACDYDTGEVK